MELTKVLIIENDEGMIHDVIEEFKKKDIFIRQASNDEQVSDYFKSGERFQMVILDWHLEEDTSSTMAKLCLQIIKQYYFLPVVIWTGELAAFQDEESDVYQDFPQAMITAYSKDNIKYDGLLEKLEEWHNLPPLSFAEDFRNAINLSTEKALYSLAKHSSDDLARGLKTLISIGQRIDEKAENQIETDIDIEHTIRVLIRLAEREIYHDQNFISKMKKIIMELNYDKNKKKKNDSQISNLYRFYQPSNNDFIVRLGDIVELNISTTDIPELKKAIVLTPACDLANPRKTLFLRLAFINEVVTNSNELESEWEFMDGVKLFRVCFHELIILKNKTLSTDEKLKVVMTYKHEYETLNHQSIKSLERKKRLEEPYRSDLLHCFVSHAGRIGKPDFSAATLP